MTYERDPESNDYFTESYFQKHDFLRWYQWCYSDDWYQLGLSKKIQIWILHGLVLGGCSVFLIVFLLVYLCRFLSRL